MVDRVLLRSDAAYFDKMNRIYAGTMGTRVHRHTCSTCGRIIEHTRLEALRDGEVESHWCCAADVRKPLLSS